jgi:hypothetical protein
MKTIVFLQIVALYATLMANQRVHSQLSAQSTRNISGHRHKSGMKEALTAPEDATRRKERTSRKQHPDPDSWTKNQSEIELR